MSHLDFINTTQFYLPYFFNVLHVCNLLCQGIQYVFIYLAKVFCTCQRMIVPFFSYHFVICDVFVSLPHLARRGSSDGCESSWHDACGPGFHPHVRHILSWRFGHENLSTDILSLPLIQEGQLSVTGERMGTKYFARRPECSMIVNEVFFL